MRLGAWPPQPRKEGGLLRQCTPPLPVQVTVASRERGLALAPRGGVSQVDAHQVSLPGNPS